MNSGKALPKHKWSVTKTGILSLIIGHYVTINDESDIKLSDGSNAHRYSITVTTQQLKNLKAPLDKGLDTVLLTTNQLGGSYLIVYAAQEGGLNEFSAVLENILDSVKFGSVGFSSNGPGFTNYEDKFNPNIDTGPAQSKLSNQSKASSDLVSPCSDSNAVNDSHVALNC